MILPNGYEQAVRPFLNIPVPTLGEESVLSLTEEDLTPVTDTPSKKFQEIKSSETVALIGTVPTKECSSQDVPGLSMIQDCQLHISELSSISGEESLVEATEETHDNLLRNEAGKNKKPEHRHLMSAPQQLAPEAQPETDSSSVTEKSALAATESKKRTKENFEALERVARGLIANQRASFKCIITLAFTITLILLYFVLKSFVKVHRLSLIHI